MTDARHEAEAMRRALELAAHGPRHGVNPRVGCVILSADGETLAEGWHRGSGSAHAEVDALDRLDGDAARGATVVVTLEPCNHTGCTGPCTEAILDAGIARVVYAVEDPGRDSGGGAARLRAAGVDVTGGVLAAEAADFLHDWLTAEPRGRPYLLLKWASSLDGRIAAADGSSRWITGTAARQHVHEVRASVDAILTGTGTVLADDPNLTARGDGGELLPDQPRPVILGRRPVARTAAVWRHPRPPLLYRDHDLHGALADLHDRGVRRILAEVGPGLASILVGSGIVDEYLVYLAPTLIGGPRSALGDIGVSGIEAQHRLEVTAVEALGHDLLVRARPRETGGTGDG